MIVLLLAALLLLGAVPVPLADQPAYLPMVMDGNTVVLLTPAATRTTRVPRTAIPTSTPTSTPAH
jgi:hypothetical protein